MDEKEKIQEFFKNASMTLPDNVKLFNNNKENNLISYRGDYVGSDNNIYYINAVINAEGVFLKRSHRDIRYKFLDNGQREFVENYQIDELAEYTKKDNIIYMKKGENIQTLKEGFNFRQINSVDECGKTTIKEMSFQGIKAR